LLDTNGNSIWQYSIDYSYYETGSLI